jgi:hypothetical protein
VKVGTHVRGCSHDIGTLISASHLGRRKMQAAVTCRIESSRLHEHHKRQ